MSVCLELLNIMTKTNVGTFGELLREKREARGWSQDTLVYRTGGIRSKGFISQIETNKYLQEDGTPMKPGLDAVDAWAIALGVSVNEFRKAAGYPLLETEMQVDEILTEFTYAVSKFKSLSEPARELARKHINEILEFLSRAGEQTQTEHRASKEINKQGIIDPSDIGESSSRAVKIDPREDIPSIDLHKAAAARNKNKKAAKNPPRTGAKGGRKGQK